MSGTPEYVLEPTTQALLDLLAEVTAHDIIWSTSASTIFQGISEIYRLYSAGQDVPDKVLELVRKLKDLEIYMSIDLERQISACDSRMPYYLSRVENIVTRAVPYVKANSRTVETGLGQVEVIFTDTRDVTLELDHFSAELQAAFIEYGLCQNLDVLHCVRDAITKLDALKIKLDKIEQTVVANNAKEAINGLHGVVSEQHGLQLALSSGNFEQIQDKYDQVTRRISNLENKISVDNFSKTSELFQKYIRETNRLNQPFTSSVFNPNSGTMINGHILHPGTRLWLLERIERWLVSKRRVFAIMAKDGTGKTTMASAMCKLHSKEVIANHFFNAKDTDSTMNNVEGLIQSIASDLFKTIPEYLDYMEEKYGNNGGLELKTFLNGTWQQKYNVLLKEPLQKLYGTGPKASAHVPRKVIVIDGLEECTVAEWSELRSFLSSFIRDLSSSLCLFLTARTKDFNDLVPGGDDDLVEIARLQDRASINRHIKDIEIYLTSALGALLVGDDVVDSPRRAKADEGTLQDTVDELLKYTAGRFDYALELIDCFTREMGGDRQFLSSVKKALQPLRKQHPDFQEEISDFAPLFRAYRDKEGRSVTVRIFRQGKELMDRSRIAMLRNRSKIHSK